MDYDCVNISASKGVTVFSINSLQNLPLVIIDGNMAKICNCNPTTILQHNPRRTVLYVKPF